MIHSEEIAKPDSDHSPFSAIFRKLLIVIVFALFPIAVLQISVRQIENLEVEKIILDQRQKHDKILFKLKPLDDDPEMIARSINRVFFKMLPANHPRQQLWVERLLKFYPESMDLFFFDPQGKVIPSLSIRDRLLKSGRTPMERAFQNLIDMRRGQKLPIDRERFMKQCFAMNDLGQLKGGYGKASFLSRREKDGFFTWYFVDPPPGGTIKGYFAFLHPGKFRKDRSLKGGVQFANKRLRSTQTGFFDTSGKAIALFPDLFHNNSEIRQALFRALGNYDQNFRSPAFHGTLVSRKENGFLFAIEPMPRFFHPGFMAAIHAGCLGWVLLILLKLPNFSRGFAARIPYKLVALFLFAVGSPALILLIGGFYALKDHSHVLMQNLEQQVKDKLKEFDDRFPAEIVKVEAQMRRIVEKAQKLPRLEDRLNLYKNFMKIPTLDNVAVINQKGETIFGFPDYLELLRTNPEIRKKEEIGHAFGREIISRLNHSLQIDPASLKGTLTVEVTSGVLNSLVGAGQAINLDEIISNLGKFRDIGLAGDMALVYFDAVSDATGMVTESLTGTIAGIKMESMYIQKKIHDLSSQADLKWRISAWGDWSGARMATKGKYKQEIVPYRPDRKIVEEIVTDARNTRSTIRKIIRHRGKDELWIGVRGDKIAKFTIVAAIPLFPLHQHIQNLWLILVSIAILVFLSTALIGSLLSDQFLRPIADLSHGIKAIEARDFEYRVPIHARDELGEMSALMNQVTEGMKDLAVARIVQENLFPQAPLELGGYRIYGRSEAMSDIGGDYFDYFQLGPNKIVGLVGDVSGHGVSAALIMGMAKCAFTTDSNIGRNLLENIDEFNRFMLKTIKKKKMMTLFLYSFDTATHTLQYVNAGHNAPMHWKASEEKAEYLEGESFPLGMRAKSSYVLKERTFGPGDSILFYTDGLVEAPNKMGVLVDYVQAKDWFSLVAYRKPEEVVGEMFTRLQTYTVGCPPADDVSLICLKRVT